MWQSPGARRLASRVAGWMTGALAYAATDAGAGEFPITAFSSSLSTLPEYVDEEALLFQFPQRAGVTNTRLFAFGLGSREALGVAGNWGSHGFFLLSQQGTLFGSSLLQGGWGASWRGLRLGVAGRAARTHDEAGSLYTSQDPFYGNQLTVDFDGTERTLWEGSFGLGLGGKNAEVDLAVDVTSIQAELTYLHLDYGRPPADTTLVHLESTEDLGLGGVARLRWHLGGGVEVVGAGSWHRVEDNYDGLEYIASRLSTVLLEHELESWFAGLSVSFPAGRIDWIAFTAHWQHLEDGQRNSSARNQSTVTDEDGILSVALRQQLWQDLWGQAGVEIGYSQLERHETRLSSDGQSLQERVSTSSTLSENFAWGVSYVWRNVDLRAAVRETLPISNLFFALDFTVHP
ncbi:MAG TPA: hypothetical protein VFE28_16530 [Candidatus Krumholzibacteria bacterium]|nr:hypothetical protein [Candidatus Krumholzibacteria bacterium]